MNSSTYNQLTIFLAIADEGGIRAAARKLEMSPPSVSKALKQLEQHMGLPMLNRTTRQMELTDAGQRLYDKAKQLVCSLNQTVDEVRELHQVPSGKLRLTMPDMAFHCLLKPIYADFCRSYPKIDLEMSASDMMVNLIKEGFDAGIRLAHRVEEGMVSLPLTPPIKMPLVASPAYLAEHGTPQTLDDLSQHRLISFRYPTSNQLSSMLLLDDGQEVTVDMPRGLIVNTLDMVIDAAQQGLGIAAVPYPALQNALNDGSLVPLLEPYWYLYPGLHLYYPQHSQKAKRIRVLVDYLRDRAIKHW